ncbi:flagellar assembly peptidoglycan hydrolase FlgJ [Ideonella paludis]|uniref:Peptidoglycan hydrolase FlgJ n=2 Tax=Ideonella paludis TaxID=1233411 RepID=A0ABS5E2X8_9BURK|nr:flagellar assembly peptidoglycan hydrolase FlgJ [Ideonella paludis]MBQ0937732.1 flagellar assembly peptidoglycan hydrolase FlgJ [Ideonella paludis]
MTPSSSLQGAGSGFGDVRGLELLKQRAAQDPKAVTREAAKQFEAIFMQELLKSMRNATLAEDPLSNEGTKLGYEMLDTQLATKLSGAPGSLSDVIARQLERQMGMSPGPIPKVDKEALAKPLELTRPDAKVTLPQKSAASFVQQHTQAAEAAEKTSGIPAEFMIAQAAHESGWGRKEIKHPDGSSAHNLFGIKATGNWKGDTVDVLTTEYSNGVARKVVQKFRAYDSYADSFKDYAQLIKNSPRYANVVAAGADAKGFAEGLQKAGYATDPAYAEKLGRVINTTLRLQRSVNG